MQNLERRLAALEAKASPEAANIKVIQVFPKDGETNDEAIRKMGHDPDAANTFYLCFVPMP